MSIDTVVRYCRNIAMCHGRPDDQIGSLFFHGCMMFTIIGIKVHSSWKHRVTLSGFQLSKNAHGPHNFADLTVNVRHDEHGNDIQYVQK